MIEKVAVGTDGSETAEKAVDFAFDVAEKFGATVVICSSYRPVSEDKVKRDQREAPEDIQWSINPTQEVDSTLNSAADRAKGRGIQTVTEAREGDPADVLCDIAEAHGADLLVVGNKGMQRRVLGSVPNSVSHKAPCSVVIVKTT
jgi:nucleotide-binding universal stress UspA family protein